jgi:hypothetical protein
VATHKEIAGQLREWFKFWAATPDKQVEDGPNIEKFLNKFCASHLRPPDLPEGVLSNLVKCHKQAAEDLTDKLKSVGIFYLGESREEAAEARAKTLLANEHLGLWAFDLMDLARTLNFYGGKDEFSPQKAFGNVLNWIRVLENAPEKSKPAKAVD